MKLQQLYSKVRQAIDDYDMIDDGDHVAVGISGGKDSLTLLYALAGLRQFYPKKFQLSAYTVDLGFQNFDLKPVYRLCEQLGVPYHVIQTQIGPIVFEERKESNPCSLCAKLRKGALYQKAVQDGCHKIAYGHHKDDMIETMLLSLLYEGRLHTFSPKTYLDQSDVTVIRPLLYLLEAEVIGFQNKIGGLPVCKNPCPADGSTKREYVKQLLRQINLDNPGVKDRMFAAITSSEQFLFQ